MSARLRALAALALLCAACGADIRPAPIAHGPLPPHDTETGDSSWRVAGQSTRGYAARLDQLVVWNKRATWHLTRVGAPEGERAWMLRRVAAAPYLNKRVRIDVDVRDPGPAGDHDLWARVRTQDGRESGVHVSLESRAEFHHASVVLDVPGDTLTLEFGPGVTSPGELWVADSSIAVVDGSVPLTSPRPTP